MIEICKRRNWRKKNRHNGTTMINMFQSDKVSVGNYTYGKLTVFSDNEKEHLFIGHFCSIAPGVTFVLEHPTNHISTFPFKVKALKSEKREAVSKGNIVVEDDVWIGTNATILSGVHIGQGAIIAAGSVVTKDVEPYAIVGGVPAKTIKYRFEPEMIEQLLKIDYSKLDYNLILEHQGELYCNLEDVDQLDWLPKKENSGF